MYDLDAAADPAQAPALTVLGLETSCDDTAAAVVRREPDGAVRVLADVVTRQDAEHAPFGGVVPEIAARAHADRLDTVMDAAMADAGLAYADLDGVAATAGPGLVGGVMVGLTTGKAVALATGAPLVAVNHLEGHALSPRLSEPVAFPYLLLLVSGGHTQLLVVHDVGRYTRLGSTIDDAAGEAFDKTAKTLGLGHPGGPALERLARDGDPTRFPLPRPLCGTPGCDFSFAGLKTAALRAVPDWDDADARDRADLAASFQAAVTDVMRDRTRAALALTGPVTALVAAGGVAANAAVRAALAEEAAAAGTPFIAPPARWCTDNAAMIALAGAERMARGLVVDARGLSARPRWPLDERAASATPASGSGRKGPKA